MANRGTKQIIFPGFVIDNKDPMMLGRVRAIPETENYEDTIKSIPNWDESKDKWSSKDPFIFIPLLPYFLYQVPKDSEFINLVYQDSESPYRNQYYIQGVFSSPMTTPFEYYEGAKKFLAQGERIEKSLALKNTDGTYKDKISFGVFPEPGDNAIMGRGSADLVIKENEVLLRAGKITELSKNKFPVENSNRAFLQLSLFTQKKILGEPVSDVTIEQDVISINKLIIWDIDNLENSVNVFNGSVGLYNLKQTEKTNSTNFKIETIQNLSIGDDYTGPIEEIKFNAKSSDEIIQTINKFIQGIYDGYVDIPGFVLKSPLNLENAVPFIVTPSKITYQKGNLPLSATGINQVMQIKNYSKFSTKIVLNAGAFERGFFLVSGKNNDIPVIGPGYKPVTNTDIPPIFLNTSITYGVMGAQRLYLLSQDSIGPKGPITFSETLYGINQDKFIGEADSISEITYPVIRGDLLMSLLQKIFAFISSHVHPGPGMPPSPTSAGNGQTTAEIFSILNNSENAILNQNIRIN